jgi:hypothetical protein
MKINIWIILQIIEASALALFGISNALHPDPTSCAPETMSFPYAISFLVFILCMLSINFMFGWLAYRHNHNSRVGDVK